MTNKFINKISNCFPVKSFNIKIYSCLVLVCHAILNKDVAVLTKANT